MESKDRALTRREFLAAAAAVAAGGVLASCGGTAEPASPTATSAAVAPTATTAATAAPPTPEPVGKFKGQIIVSARDTTTSDKAYLAGQEALVKAYKEVQPDVEVIFEAPPGGIEGGYGSWLTTQLAAGDIRLDICSGVDAGSYNNYVNFDNYRSLTNPYTGEAWDKGFDFDRFKWSNATGQRYQLAQRIGAMLWLYNKTLFDQAGVTPPQTWSEFIDVCAKLEAANINPIAMNFLWQGHQWVSGIYFDQYHVDWVETVRAQPGDWCYDPESDGKFEFDPTDRNIHSKYTYNAQRYFQGIRDGTLRFDTDAFAEMIDNMSQVWPKYTTGDMFVRTDDCYPTFLQQEAAMILGGTWMLKTVDNDLKELSPERLEELGIDDSSKVKTFEWGVFHTPTMEGPLVKCPAKDVAGQAHNFTSIVNKDQEQVERVMDFVMFWFSKPGATAYDSAAYANGWSPLGPSDVRGVVDDPEMLKYYEMFTPQGNAEINQNNWEYFSGYESYDNPHVTNVKNKYKEALERKMTGAEFAEWFQEYFTSNLPDILELKGLTAADLDNPARQPGT